LAREGVGTPKNPKKLSIENLLIAEHQKVHGRQGTRTCARELRRFFNLLNFITQAGENGWEVTPLANSLLALHSGGARSETQDIWRQALWNLNLEDETGSSHPYRILIRLVANHPGLPKPYAGLCLEAKDDSEKEFGRICKIASKPAPSNTMDVLATKFAAKNSVKILPSVAQQLGDVILIGNKLFPSELIINALAGSNSEAASADDIQQALRPPSAPRVRGAEIRKREVLGTGPTTRIYDPDLLAVRTNAHEQCLDRFCQLFPSTIARLEATYDLLLLDSQNTLLVEAKTIRDDAPLQVRLALGQLFYYEYFDVAPRYPTRRISFLLLTDRKISDELQSFLEEHDVGFVWSLENGEIGGSNSGLALLQAFSASLP